MAVLFFVGCDKTGKSTLFRNVLKKSNRHIVVDRFTACQFVYGNHHKHEDTPSMEYLRQIETALKGLAGFIWVEAYIEDIVVRFEEHDETDIDEKDIELIMQQYREYVNNTYTLPVLYLNTSIATIDVCTDEILKFGDWIDKGGREVYEENGPGRILF